VRYADDFVIGFQSETEAKTCLEELRERRAAFNLELYPEKTHLIEFGRYAGGKPAAKGDGQTRDVRRFRLHALLREDP
jgi:hypothetical protein